MSLITSTLTVYQVINTQAPVGWEENTSSIESLTYDEFLPKLFIVSILGIRLPPIFGDLFYVQSTKDQGVFC
jgi:hypothetical protein